MERYKNLNGDSGVASHEIGYDSIWVVFSDGVRYQYTYARTGKENVERMKRLAVDGRGLSSFIARNPALRNGYAEKRP